MEKIGEREERGIELERCVRSTFDDLLGRTSVRRVDDTDGDHHLQTWFPGARVLCSSIGCPGCFSGFLAVLEGC